MILVKIVAEPCLNRRRWTFVVDILVTLVSIGVHRTSACTTFSEVINKIVQKSNHWIAFPRTVEELNLAKEARLRIRPTIGALDRLHSLRNKQNKSVDGRVR